jgi:hypothetical protein
MKTSTSKPPETKVIITLETSGEFLQNVARVLDATGLTLEQLFEYLSVAAGRLHRTSDMMIEPMMNDRLPESIQAELSSILTNVVEDLSHSTSHFVDQLGDFHLVEVLDDDLAVVEITPAGGDTIVDPASVVHPRRRRMVVRHKPKTLGGDGGSGPEGCH